MNYNTPIFDKERFTKFIALFGSELLNIDYLYDVYKFSFDAIEMLMEKQQADIIQPVNSLELIQYVVGEYLYSVSSRSKSELDEFHANEQIKASMASVVADKYVSLSSLTFKEKKLTNKYLPPISSLSIYINFMLNILKHYRKNDPQNTLITDLLTKSLSIAKCTMDLLVDGFETQAFSCWRTLHECECTLTILAKYGPDVINIYNKHIQYSIVFKDAMKDKDKQSEIFYSMKDEMKEYDLKSKDIKKYIEYGWLYSVPGVKEDETFKLNFRDGLEKVAGLSSYSTRYEMSSEIIHSTPMLIYSNKEYFYYLTLISLYESFFRLESVFTVLFQARVTDEQMKAYMAMRKIYFSQLLHIHKREIQNFNYWQNKKTKKEA